MRIAGVLVLVFFSAASGAADRNQNIRSLMEAQGLLQMFQDQMALGRQQSREQADQMLNQFMGTLSAPKTFEARFRAASEKFVKSLETPWTAQDIVDVWAKAYGSRFTDQELDDLLKYYSSPLGQKDVAASQAALPELSKHFAALTKPLFERATRAYIADLQQIAKECNCRK